MLQLSIDDLHDIAFRQQSEEVEEQPRVNGGGRVGGEDRNGKFYLFFDTLNNFRRVFLKGGAELWGRQCAKRKKNEFRHRRNYMFLDYFS